MGAVKRVFTRDAGRDDRARNGLADALYMGTCGRGVLLQWSFPELHLRNRCWQRLDLHRLGRGRRLDGLQVFPQPPAQLKLQFDIHVG